MIKLMEKVVEIHCDVPGCNFGQVVVVPALAMVRSQEGRQLSEESSLFLVRTRAEADHGWFLEKIATRYGTVLERDVCPRQAPAYRTLLALSGAAERPDPRRVHG